MQLCPCLSHYPEYIATEAGSLPIFCIFGNSTALSFQFPATPSAFLHVRLVFETCFGRTNGPYRSRKLQKPVSGARLMDSTPEICLECMFNARNMFGETTVIQLIRIWCAKAACLLTKCRNNTEWCAKAASPHTEVAKKHNRCAKTAFLHTNCLKSSVILEVTGHSGNQDAPGRILF